MKASVYYCGLFAATSAVLGPTSARLSTLPRRLRAEDQAANTLDDGANPTSELSLPMSSEATSTGEVEPEAIESVSIGIIGAGAAGLTTAYLLKKKGYDVTILESTDSVGGVARTEFVNGKAYDMSTMFIPGGSLLCTDTSSGDDTSCIEPTLKEMIDVSNELLEPSDDFFTLNTATKELNRIPEPLQKYDPSDIISELIRGYGFTLQLLQCVLTEDFTAHPVCSDDKMLLSIWGEKYQAPAYADVITYVFDGLGAGPSALGATFAMSSSSFVSVEVAQILRDLGVTPASLDGKYPDNVISLLSKPRWLSFKNGYQTFWESLAKNANIDVKSSIEVSAIDRDQDKWKVASNNGAYHFDHIIVATPPLAATKFLPDGEQKELIGRGIFAGPSNVIFIAEGNDPDLPFSEDGEYAFWPKGLGQGTAGLINPFVGNSLSKPFFWIKRHKGRNVFTVATYELLWRLDDNVYDAVREYGKEVLGIELNDTYLHVVRYSFPDGRPDWYGPLGADGAWNALQGNDNLWFNGEAIAGSGVPDITQFSKKFVDEYF